MVCFFHEKACKGTTKNAHEQIFFKKNVFLDKKVYREQTRIVQ